MPIAMLAIGPAAAIKSSEVGDGGSFSVCAMPPKMKSVMRRTGMPKILPTSAWESSCSSTDTKKRTAAPKATPHTSPGPQSGCQLGNTATARFTSTSAKMMIRLQSATSWMPATRPKGMPPRPPARGARRAVSRRGPWSMTRGLSADVPVSAPAQPQGEPRQAGPQGARAGLGNQPFAREKAVERGRDVQQVPQEVELLGLGVERRAEELLRLELAPAQAVRAGLGAHRHDERQHGQARPGVPAMHRRAIGGANEAIDEGPGQANGGRRVARIGVVAVHSQHLRGLPSAPRARRCSSRLTAPAESANTRISQRDCGNNSVVECNLAKVEVEGSNPFSRST